MYKFQKKKKEQIISETCTLRFHALLALLVLFARVARFATRENLLTTLALVQLLVGVRQAVPLQPVLENVRPPAHLAQVRLLAVVRRNMNLHIRRLAESLPAQLALVRLLVPVRHEMPLQVHHVGEAFPTHLALERLLGVRQFMRLQGAGERVTFPAGVALEQTVGVYHLTSRQTGLVVCVRLPARRNVPL